MAVQHRYGLKMIRYRRAEQKRLKTGSKACENEINKTTSYIPVGSWRYDAGQDRFYWSEGACRIHGLIPLCMATTLKDFLRLLHPDDRLKALDRVIGCLEGQDYQFEYRIPQRNGGFKSIGSIGTPLFGQDQRPVGMFGTVWNVTEKGKRLEAEVI